MSIFGFGKKKDVDYFDGISFAPTLLGQEGCNLCLQFFPFQFFIPELWLIDRVKPKSRMGAALACIFCPTVSRYLCFALSRYS